MRFQRRDFESSPCYRNQRGGSIGTFFSGLFKKLLPFAKTILGLGTKAVKSQAGQNIIGAAAELATDAGKELLKDVIEGKNVKQSTKRQLKEKGSVAVKRAKKTAVKAGLNIVEDALKGKNLKAAAKQRITEATKDLLDKDVAADKMKRSRGSKGATKKGGKGKKGKRGGGKKGKRGGGPKGRKLLKIRKNSKLGKQLVRQWL